MCQILLIVHKNNDYHAKKKKKSEMRAVTFVEGYICMRGVLVKDISSGAEMKSKGQSESKGECYLAS